jgi:hypothetical protein
MASMNMKMLEEFLFHSNKQQFSRTNMTVRVGVGVTETCDSVAGLLLASLI